MLFLAFKFTLSPSRAGARVGCVHFGGKTPRARVRALGCLQNGIKRAGVAACVLWHSLDSSKWIAPATGKCESVPFSAWQARLRCTF